MLLLLVSSVWRHPASRYFTACFRDQNGRQRRITTKETNRRKALKIAEAYEKVGRTRRTNLHTKRVIERLHEEIGGEPICAVSLRSFAETWLATKTPEVSPRTLDFYRKSVAKLLAWLGPKADEPVTEIIKADLVAYRNFLAERVSSVTANHDLRGAKMLFLAARRDGVLLENPAEFVEGVRQRNGSGTQRRAFSIDELKAILGAADPEWRSMIKFGIYTGQRLSDIAQLTWSNIDLEKGELRLTTQKTGKLLILPLASPLQRHLEELPCSDDPDTPLHPSAAKALKNHGRTAALSNQFADLLADVGLRPRKDHQSTGKGRDAVRLQNALSFHSLRRTATTLLHEAGIPQQVVQAMIGHDSASSPARCNRHESPADGAAGCHGGAASCCPEITARMGRHVMVDSGKGPRKSSQTNSAVPLRPFPFCRNFLFATRKPNVKRCSRGTAGLWRS
jgi:integrase